MPNTPVKRPDVEGIEARVKKAQCYSGYCFGLLGGSPFDDIPALIAWIEALEARQVKLWGLVANVEDAQGLLRDGLAALGDGDG